MQVSTSLPHLEETKLDEKLEMLIDQFERDVAPYDRWSRISMVATSAGVVSSIVLPLLLLEPVVALYPTVAGIAASIALTKIPILYADRKKHQISREKYKPVTGICMCDLYQYRTHLHKIRTARSTAERIRHSKLASYYRRQMGL
ncbi:MAG TPA: hypothetical protein VNI77_03960 [Nitrososphaera sp.]|nr:hypothetical protein [Nitrososphaera sp.]